MEFPWGSKAARATPPVATGALVALPILAAADGTPFDLLAAAADRAAVLLIVPADSQALRDVSITTASLAARVEASGARLFIIAPTAESATDTTSLLIDHDGRFAYTLGLADWDHRLGRAEVKKPAALVLDRVGRVIAADLDGSPDLERLIEALPVQDNPDPEDEAAW